MADNNQSIGSDLMGKRIELVNEISERIAANVSKSDGVSIETARIFVKNNCKDQVDYLVARELNTLAAINEIIGDNARIDRLASVAQGFAQKTPKEDIKNLPQPDYSGTAKVQPVNDTDIAKKVKSDPTYQSNKVVANQRKNQNPEISESAKKEFDRRIATYEPRQQRVAREAAEAKEDAQKAASDNDIDPSPESAQEVQNATQIYEQKLKDKKDAETEAIKPSREHNKPNGFYQKAPRSQKKDDYDGGTPFNQNNKQVPKGGSVGISDENLGPKNEDGSSNFIDPNTGKYTKTNPAETKKQDEKPLNSTPSIDTSAKAEGDKNDSDPKDYESNPTTPNDFNTPKNSNVSPTQRNISNSNVNSGSESTSTTDGGKKEGEDKKPDNTQESTAQNNAKIPTDTEPEISKGEKTRGAGRIGGSSQKFGGGQGTNGTNQTNGTSGPSGQKIGGRAFGSIGGTNPNFKGSANSDDGRKKLPEFSNRNVAAGAAKSAKNFVRGAGNIAIGAGEGVKSAGTNVESFGQNLEKEGKTADGQKKSGLGNAAKRFLGKDIAKTGEHLGAAGDKLKQAGEEMKKQIARAVARAIIGAMPAIATALAFLLVFTMMMAILILIFCKAMENPAAEVVARFAGVPAEFKKICKDAGFSTAGCDSNTSSTGSGYDCKSNRIKAPGVDIADVRYVPDNKNLYYALIMMRAQEFNGLDENFVGGDRDSCGPYQQRLQEIASGANGQLAVKAREIFGKPITSCSQLVKEGGNAFFDKLALERLKLEGAYDKISGLNLQPGNGSVYLLAQQLCNTQRPDAYSVAARECPINSYYVKNLGKSGEAFLASNQYEKRKAGCTGNGIPTDVPAKDTTVKPAHLSNPDILASFKYSFSKITGSIDVIAQSSATPTATQTSDAKPTSSSLDLDSIAKQTGVQSISVQELGTTGIQSYNGSTPPASPASSIKAVVADVVINEIKNGKLKLSDTITLTGKTALYNQETQKTVTVKEAVDAMLSRSSNDYTNLLVEKLGGPGSGINSKISSLGYSTTKFNEYLRPGGKASNVITAEEFSTAMNKIWQDPNAKSALSKNADKFGIDSIGNKDAGNSLVTGNSAIVDVNGKKYIISTFYNGNGEAVNNVGANDVKIKDATNAVIAQLKAGKTINPNSSSAPSSTGTSDCNGTTSGSAGNGTVDENKIKEYAQKDCKGEIKLTVERNNACAFTATNILRTINPSLADKISTVDTWCMYNGFECPKQGGILNNGGKLVNSASEIQNYGLVFYGRNPSGNKSNPTNLGGGLDIGHVGVVYRGTDGKLKEVSNYSRSCTHIHNSPEEAVAAYSGTYGGAVYIAIQ